jgi:AraC-like DNA-binding protein
MSQRVTEDAWRLLNPAALTSKQVVDIETLADAEIEVISSERFVQHLRQIFRPNRVLNHMLFYMPLRGAIRLKSGEQEWTVTSNDLILLAAGQPHEAISLKSRFEVATIHAHVHLEAALPNEALFSDTVHRLKDAPYWHKQMDVLISLQQQPTCVKATGEILRQLLMSLVVHGKQLMQRNQASDPRIERALLLMRSGIHRRVSLDEVGREVGLGSSQFRLLFRRQMGISPKAYQKELRLREVVRLLRQSVLSMKQIAAKVGYANPQHLQREFRHVFGISPARFCKKN